MMALSTKQLPVAPVLFIVFNRPDTTQRVFEAIRMAKPSRLYIAADGFRKDVAGDQERCEETRNVVGAIDWDCRVFKLFRSENAGCGRGVCEAINWFFENEEEGIILEDDGLPAPSFLKFCTALLSYYKVDHRVMGIGGNNFGEMRNDITDYSYRFSSIISIWGWATWRRAWQFNDFYMKRYPEIVEKKYLKTLYNSAAAIYLTQ